MKICTPYPAIPHRPTVNHVRFARPPSSVLGEEALALTHPADMSLGCDRDVDAASLLRPGTPLRAPSPARSDVSNASTFTEVSDADAAAPSPFDMPAFPTLPTAESAPRMAASWAARLVSVFDVWVERVEQVVEVLRLTVNGWADETTCKVSDVHAKLVGAVNTVSNAITASLENVRFRVHGFFGRKI